MRVLVTGAAGFVGRQLVQRLARDHEIVALVRAMPAWEMPTVKTIVADLTSPSVGARLPRDVDVIIHLAQAYKTFPEHAAEIFAVNATSTQRLADHARAAGTRRFVLASSGSIYSPAEAPLRETDIPRPMGFHPATKLIAEQVLDYYADPLEVVALRLFAPYGPGQVDRLIPRLIDSVRNGSPIVLSRGGEPALRPIFISDLVEVFAQAVTGSGNGVVNIAGPVTVSIRDIAELAGEVLGQRPVFVDQDREPFGDLVADTSAMERQFHLPGMIEPRSGIRRTIVEDPARA
jgi:nucleoside-diphosphate-sugar epimerase